MNPVHQIWAAVATIITVVAAVVVLTLAGKDAGPLLLVIAAVVTPIVTAIFINNRVQQVKETLSSVEQKVNGHLTALTAKIPDAQEGGSNVSG